MDAKVLILGQGLAGTLLACELERARIPFVIVDPGHAAAATSAAAGIINPITGRRLVKSARIESLLPLARATYRELETTLRVSLWREMRVRRIFADERERAVFTAKQRTGELAPFVESADATGCWIRDAARVDLAALLAATRARWLADGSLRSGKVLNLSEEITRHEFVIDCRGLEGARAREFDFVPWEFSKGEMLELEVESLAPDVILNRRHWIVPFSERCALVGATHEPGIRDREPSVAARDLLEASARQLLGANPFSITTQRAGVRVNLPDKRPVAGRHPERPHLGLINGLGAKGALWAPFLARQWVDHLATGAVFDREIDVGRFTAG